MHRAAVEEPRAGQLRVRVRAAGVGSTDLMVLAGKYRYAPEYPGRPRLRDRGRRRRHRPGVTGFTLGQRVAALTVHGGFAELLVREAEHFLPIPDGVSDVQAAGAILNYVTAWQMIHRVAKVSSGQTALVTGAAGGVGTAALQILRLAGVKTYGAASPKKHETVRKLGAIPIDYRAGRLDRLVRELEPRGVDCAFDAVGGANIGLCIRATRRGGTVVGYGFMGVKERPRRCGCSPTCWSERGCGDGGARSTGSRCCTGRTRSRSARTCRRSSRSSPRRSSTRWSA